MLLNDPITKIKGIGEKRAKLFGVMDIFTIEDLLCHFPRDYDDRSDVRKITDLIENEENTFFAFVSSTPETVYFKNLSITKAKLSDETGSVTAVWYNQPFMKNAIRLNEEYIFTGLYKKSKSRKEISSPEFEKASSEELLGGGRIVPIYPITAGLSQKIMRVAIKTALSELKAQLIDFIPADIRKKYKLCDRNFAVYNIHFPENNENFFMARERLVFEELFLLQTALLTLKGKNLGEKTNKIFKTENILNEASKALGFDFTNAQKRVVSDIANDVESGKTMNRLIQGDVGSGKTAVAMCAALMALKSGFQAVLMAPTEVLATQHYESFKKFFDNFGFEVCILKGSLKKSEKNAVKERILNGQSSMIIGTHALIQEDVEFKNLGLIITDEQHRFGVKQRNSLSLKGYGAHVMVMTATPIPRTLALILYGDLDISVIDELPPGRKSIETIAVNSSYHKRIYGFIKKEVSNGRQAYIVCPMVEESESIDAKAVETMCDELKDTEFKGINVSILHGKMKAAEKENIMNAFSKGDIKILISTTVIEVGINVPNATIMLIENAERFGLSQLHQLRGRVGRGSDKSYCILVTDSKNEVTQERMRVMKKTNDGFEISETDLKLRGPGEFFGTKQHGLPQLKIANLYRDALTLSKAQESAADITSNRLWYKEEKYSVLKKKISDMFLDNGNIGI